MTFVSSALVVLRESFEAFLIVGIMVGLVTKLGAPQHRRIVYWGTAAGIAASLLLGWILLQVASGLRADYEIGFEAVASLVAVAVLTYMIVWMHKHTQDLFGAMQGRLRAAIEAGALGVLFFIPFIAVLREGFETVLLLAASSTTGLALVGAIAVGVAAAVTLGVLLFSGIIRLNVRTFFAVTGGLLVLFAAWMLRYGIHELGELVEGRNHALGELLEGPLAWAAGAAYLAAFGFWYLRPLLRPGQPTAQPTQE